MVERRRRKKNKLRGQRTHGGGNTKNRRGAGTRGGRGRAGSKTHKYVKYLLEGTLKKKIKLKKKTKTKGINLGTLNEQIETFVRKGLVEKKDEEYIIDGNKLKKKGITKILSAGKINKKLLVRNIKVSKKAVEKILQANGKIEGLEGIVIEEDEEFGESEEITEEIGKSSKEDSGEKFEEMNEEESFKE